MHSCGCHYFILMPRAATDAFSIKCLRTGARRVFVWFHTEFSAAAVAARAPRTRTRHKCVCVYFLPFITARRGGREAIKNALVGSHHGARRARVLARRCLNIINTRPMISQVARCLHAILWSAGT
jgi:hypothetical protein